MMLYLPHLKKWGDLTSPSPPNDAHVHSTHTQNVKKKNTQNVAGFSAQTVVVGKRVDLINDTTSFRQNSSFFDRSKTATISA